MTDTDAPPDADRAQPPIDRLVAETQAGWRDEAKALGKLAAAFGPLSKARAYQDAVKLPALLAKVEQKVRALPVAARGAVVLDQIREDLRERRRRMQETLAKDLRVACEAQGLALRVVRREEPVEVRIPPFAVQIDREKGRAELQFARQPIASCEADAGAILKAHAAASSAMARAFEPARFFEACRKAWSAACGAGSGGAGERVELLDFLPYLALEFQTPAFRVEPSERNYRGYSRARFAFDVMQLRNAGGLSHAGWRLNLGVATGTSASKKNRVIYFEDEQGNGEFKLTVFFTRTEER